MPLSADRPYRDHLIHWPATDIEALNRYFGWTGSNALQPAEEELAFMLKFPNDRREVLAKHPDERVQAALLTKVLSAPISLAPNTSSYRFADTTIRLIFARLQAYWATENAFAWPPVADLLATPHLMPSANFKPAFSILTGWIRAFPHTAPAVLLSSKSPYLHLLLAEHPSCLTPDQIRQLVALNPDYLDVAVRSAATLTQPQIDTLAELALASIKTKGQGVSVLDLLRSPVRWLPSAADISDLIPLVAPIYAQTPSQPGRRAGRPDRPHFDQLFIYLSNLPLTEEQLTHLFKHATPTRDWTLLLLKYASATDNFFRLVASLTDDPSVLAALFNNPPLAADPSFRARLAASPYPNLWVILCINASTAEFNYLFPKIAHAAPKYIPWVLSQATFPPGAQIDPQVFKDLLLDPKPSIRELAIKTIALMAKPDAPAPRRAPL